MSCVQLGTIHSSMSVNVSVYIHCVQDGLCMLQKHRIQRVRPCTCGTRDAGNGAYMYIDT